MSNEPNDGQDGGREAVEVVKLQHMAVADHNGLISWMTGRFVADCELYAMPDFGRASELMTVAQHERIVAAITAQQGASVAVPVYVCSPNSGGEPFLIRRAPDSWELRECKIAAVHAVEESIFEDVYWQVADLIEPYVNRPGNHGLLPASIVDSVRKLVAMLAAAPKPASLSPVAGGVVVPRELLDSRLKKLACHPGMLFTPIPGLLKTYDELRALLAQQPAPSPVQLSATRVGRVYLAGPMTGYDNYNFAAFNAEADRLRAQGFHVENPADHGLVDGADWADYLRYDISRLASCERIHLLPGWSKSKGANLEVRIALSLGMPVYYADDTEPAGGHSPVSGLVEALEAFDRAAKESGSIIGFAGKSLGLVNQARAALAAYKAAGGDV